MADSEKRAPVATTDTVAPFGAARDVVLRPCGRRRRNRQTVIGWATIAPVVGLLALLIGFPIGYSFWLGVFRKHAFLPAEEFVFLGNYLATFQDPEFWRSVWLGIWYTVATTALQVVIGVQIALLLHRIFWGRGLVRAIVLFPYMLPNIVAVILWKWVLNDQWGIVNYTLMSWGIIREPIVWIGYETIMGSLIAVSVWTFFPFVVISVLARLQIIPPELYDAARVDGASPVRCFFHVTLPQIRNVLVIVILLRGIWMFTKFDIVWLWAGGYGGLGTNVRTLPVYTYMKTFGQYQAGLGAAVANLMFVLLLVGIALYFRMFRYVEE